MVEKSPLGVLRLTTHICLGEKFRVRQLTLLSLDCRKDEIDETVAGFLRFNPAMRCFDIQLTFTVIIRDYLSATERPS